MEKEINHLYQGKSIFCRVTGNGRPVMLVHGFGEDGEIWNNQVEYLKKDFQLIVPDLPGTGKSEIIDDMSMEGLADALNSLVLEIRDKDAGGNGMEKFCMIGHSMGGYITLAYAEKFMHQLNGFGLFHSTAFADSDEKKAVRQKGIDFVREHGSHEFFKTSTPNLYSARTKEQRPSLVNEHIENLIAFSDEALEHYYRSMMQRPDRTNVLINATVPVLFIIGEEDKAVSPEDMLKQSHLPSRSFIHVFKNSGHMGMVEEIEKSNIALEEFLGEV